MRSFEEKIKEFRLIPVVSLPDVDSGLRLANILSGCGLNVMEITFRTACAPEAIKKIRARFPDMLLIAGTVITPDQARAAAQFGAEAIVSPGCEPGMIHECKTLGMPVIPGVCTPSEVQAAISHGLFRLKFFPAEISGGAAMAKTLLSVYGNISLMPTGGINQDNLLSYLALDRVFCCGGTWLAPEKLMINGEWGTIENRIETALELISTNAVFSRSTP